MAKKYLHKPKVSIIVPAYNGSTHIAEALDSVLKQTYQDFEIIVISEPSDDGTPQIVEAYIKNDKRISLHLNKQQVGPSSNRNRGISLAKGQYIKILCQNDVLMPDYLKIFVNIMDSHKTVSLITSYEQLIGEINAIRKVGSFPSIGEIKGKWAQSHIMQYGNWIGRSTSTIFRQRDLHVGLFDLTLKRCFDWDMWMRLLSIGNLYVIPRILSCRRIITKKQSGSINSALLFHKEKVKILNFTFQFTGKYGEYSNKQKSLLWSKYIQKFIQQSYSLRKKEFLRTSFEFLREFSGLNIFIIFNKELLRLIFRKVFNNNFIIKKIKLFLQKIKNLSDSPWKKRFKYQYYKQTIDINNSPININGLIEVPVNRLRARIWTPAGLRSMPIKNTPHYKWIKDLIDGIKNDASYTIYKNYIQTFFPEIDCAIAKKNITNLVKSFSPRRNIKKSITIATFPPSRKPGSLYSIIIFDGIHRSAIAEALGDETVNCQLVPFKYSDQFIPFSD